MKWFQHESNARNDIKLKMLQKAFGNDGYAIYFKMLEIIAEYANEKNLNEWGFVDRFHDTKTLAEECNIDADRLASILKKCNELDLFEKKNHRLYCEKILKRLDNYAQQVRRKAKNSGNPVPEKEEKKELRSDYEETSPRREEKRESRTAEKDCHNTLTPCDDYCTWQIGIDMDTHKHNVDDVKKKLERYIKQHPKKYKVFHDTLVTWVQGDLDKGDILPMTDMEALDMPLEHPDKVKQRLESARINAGKGAM